MSRALAVAGFVGGLLAYGTKLVANRRWLAPFLEKNELADGDRRGLLELTAGGAALACALVVAATLYTWRRGGDAKRVERHVWLVAPIGVLGVLPMLLARAPWQKSELALLLSVAVAALAFEGSLLRSLPLWPAAIGERVTERVTRLLRRIPERALRHAPLAAVVAGALGYALFMGRWSILRHRKLGTRVFDTGIWDNLMFNALKGNFMQSPIFSGNKSDAPEFLANHAPVGQYLFLPLYAIAPRAETLLLIQSTFAGLSAILLFLFFRRRLSNAASVTMSFAYLAYPPLHAATLWEMSYIVIGSTLVLATILTADIGRWAIFVPVFLATLVVREDFSIGLAIVGAVLLLSGFRPGMGAVMIVASVAYFALVRLVIMEEAGQWDFPKAIYGELLPKGAEPSFKAVLFTIATNPVFVFQKLLTAEKLLYLLHLLVPLALLPVRRAWLLAALLPGALLTLITSYGPTVQVGFHYVMHWTPYLFVAAGLALEILRKQSPSGTLRLRAALATLCFTMLVLTTQYGAFARRDGFRIGFNPFDFTYTAEDADRYRRLRALIAQIPPDATVSATHRVGPHISNRLKAYLTDYDGFQNADFVLFNRAELPRHRNSAYLKRALIQSEYGVVTFDTDFALLEKGHPTTSNAELAKSWNLKL